jgi:hypothetical protein
LEEIIKEYKASKKTDHGKHNKQRKTPTDALENLMENNEE